MSAPANGSKLQGAPEPADADALTALRSAWERGRGEHPDLEIAFDDFAAAASRRLRRRIGPVDEVADACVAGDLYLAIACEIGRPGTAERLRDHVVPALRERAELAEPVVAEVFGDLATGERLAQYAGAGSLVGWLAVGARRAAMTSTTPAVVHRESDVLGAALREGWATLAARERVVLALRVLRSVRQSDLAVMLGIGAPRAGRLVAGSLDKLHAAVASRLDAVVGAAGRRRIWEELARTDAEPEGSRTAERGHVAELLARTAAATVGPSAAACPEAEQLAGFAEGQLTATEGGLVERHLADCADCLDLVAALGRTRAPHANEPSSGSEVRAVPVLRYVLLGIALAAAIVAVALFVRPAMLFETPAAIAAWKLVAVPASSDSDRELSLEVELRSPAFVSVLLMFRDEHDLRVQYRSWQLAADPAAQVLPRTGEASWPFVPRAAFAVYVVTSTRPVDLTSIVESVREAAGDQALTIYECDAVKAVLAERFDYVDARFVVPG